MISPTIIYMNHFPIHRQTFSPQLGLSRWARVINASELENLITETSLFQERFRPPVRARVEGRARRHGFIAALFARVKRAAREYVIAHTCRVCFPAGSSARYAIREREHER